ncbi:hypothetical protein FCL40_08725 [Ferrimonas sediminicola]|uniref:Chalcone isomerase-like n=1 Tax=Ferrimonas sediminicola TaxID=2569538 RepID=A0A4U1BEE1_9GAMM|nr:hypothetical protein [Ferrimonas sediminicola]TKB49406.1 hypothetical protein FCL40_08725 [Ferrimonas sediminicola]
MTKALPTLLLLFSLEASALPLVGESKLRVLFWDIYTARLYAPDGQYAGITPPLILSLTYHRRIDAEALMEATEEQWQRLGFIDRASRAWLARLAPCFPDVAPGDRLSFSLSEDGGAQLSYNDAPRCRFTPSAGNRRFLAIWLSPRSAYPGFTRRLIAKGE